MAQGAGKDSDITVTGSTLSAGNNVVLKAEGDILLQAARNAFEQKTDSKSSSASIGIGYSTGGQQNGWTLKLGASGGRGNANGKGESWTNTHVTTGNILVTQSGGDTTLKGATGKAEQIIASVGGNLLLESLQDSSKYDAKNNTDRCVFEIMSSSLVVFAAVKGLSPLDSDGMAAEGKGPKPGGSTRGPSAKPSIDFSEFDTSITSPGSKFLNVRTNLNAEKFELNLIENGFSVTKKGVGKNGEFNILTNGFSNY